MRTLAGIIWDSGAASIRDCQVLVELGITNPNSKNHSGETVRETVRQTVRHSGSQTERQEDKQSQAER